jgi:hypothetical protein
MEDLTFIKWNANVQRSLKTIGRDYHLHTADATSKRRQRTCFSKTSAIYARFH